MEQKHSAPGIASFVLSLFAGVLMMVLFIIAGVLNRQTPHGPYPGQMFIGFAAMAFIGLELLAAGLGIGSLFQKERKKMFGILGLCFSLLTIVGTVALVIFGLTVARRM